MNPVTTAAPAEGPLFDTALIVGIGHIGASVALNLKKTSAVRQLLASDNTPQHLQIALACGLADQVGELEEMAPKADLVILCTPVGAVDDVCRRLSGLLKPGCVVSDVGSTKLNVLEAMEEHLPPSIEVVPAHPIAGIEKSGPSNAIANLFENRWIVLTPSKRASAQAVELVESVWTRFGAMVTHMSAEHHDQVLAATSHLPHLIAYCIVDTANQLGQDLKQEVIRYSAGGFRDVTRIAGSDPVMWRDVFLHNREAVLEVLDRFTEDLSALRRAIRKGDGELLESKFQETRAIRQTIVDAGQAGQFDPSEQKSKD